MKKFVLGLLASVFAGLVLAADIDLSVGSSSAAFSAASVGRSYRLYSTINFANNPVASTGTVTIVNVPAEVFVRGVQAEVTSLGAYPTSAIPTGRFTIGDNSASNAWITVKDFSNLTSYVSSPTITAATTATDNGSNATTTVSISPANALGKYYTSANRVLLKGNTAAITSGVMSVWVDLIDYRNP